MDKILKTLESIKVPSLNLQQYTESNIPGQVQSAVVAAGDSVKTKKKERINHSLAVTDAVCASSVQNLVDYPKLLESVSEVLFVLCDDADSDIRLVATDCLNRIAHSLKDQLLHRFQMEIYKEIKRNQSPRSLRTALNLFAYMSPFIRPQKCRAFIQSLFPCFSQIAKRDEDLLYESLAESLSKIFANLGTFFNDEEMKALSADFLLNLESSSSIVRRASATILVSLCRYSLKEHVYVPRLLQLATDLLMPNVMEKPTTLIIGALVCIRQCLEPAYDYLSINYRSFAQEQSFLVLNIVKIFEHCMMLCNHDDHNVITTTLETLLALLSSPPEQILMKFAKLYGLDYHNIIEKVNYGLKIRHEARHEVYEKIDKNDPSLYELDPATVRKHAGQIFVPRTDNSGANSFDSSTDEKGHSSLGKSSPVPHEKGKTELSVLEKSNTTSSLGSTTVADESLLECDSDVPEFGLPDHVIPATEQPEAFDIDASISSGDINSDIFIMATASEPEDEKEEGTVGSSDGEAGPPTRRLIENIPEFDIGSLFQADIPLHYCARFLAYNFLLSGRKGSLRQELESRISVKVLAMNCMTKIILQRPEIYYLSLRNVRRSSREPFPRVDEQFMHDVSLFVEHSDPQLRSCTYGLIGNFTKAVLVRAFGTLTQEFPIRIADLISMLKRGLKDSSNVVVRSTISAVGGILEILWRCKNGSKYANDLLANMFECVNNSYWLIKVTLAESFSGIKWDSVLNRRSGQVKILDLFLHMLTDEDARVRSATVDALIKFVVACGESTKFNCGKMHALCEGCVVNEIHYDTRSCYFKLHLDVVQRLWVETVVNRMSGLLLRLDTKHAIAGYYAAFTALSDVWPPETYSSIWRCKNDVSELPLLFGLTMDNMRTSFVATDLVVHQSLFSFLTKLFVATVNCSKSKEINDEINFFGSCSKKLSDFGMQLLYHSITLIKLYHTTIKNSTDGVHAKKALLSPISSPGKKAFKFESDKRLSDSEAAKKGENDIFQSNLNAWLALSSDHFEKVSEAVHQSWKLYKSNLDTTVEFKFISLLTTALNTLGEVCWHLKNDYKNLPNIIEDTLNMTPLIFHICPNSTLKCIHMMLKCLLSPKSEEDDAFNTLKRLKSKSTVLGLLKFWKNFNFVPKPETKSLYDAKVLGNYIRPFEPIVVTALKMYTTSTDVSIQTDVLSLLCELIKGHVNYAHVDSNQIFLGFVIKQVDYFAQGHIRNSATILSKMFEFFSLLSKEEIRPKKFIDFEKVISLCESLLASSEHPSTHSIPALRPVVLSLFVTQVKTGLSPSELQLVESQGDMVLSLLLKLIGSQEALPLILTAIISRRNQDFKFQVPNAKFLKDCKNISSSLMEALFNSELIIQDRLHLEYFIAVLFSLDSRALDSSECLMRKLSALMREFPEFSFNNQAFLHPYFEQKKNIQEFTCWCSKIAAILLIQVRKYKNLEYVSFSPTSLVEVFAKVVQVFKGTIPSSYPDLNDLGLTLVIVVLQCARVLINIPENKSHKENLIIENEAEFYETAIALVKLSIVHPVARRELVKLLYSFGNRDKELWDLAFSSWQEYELKLEFLIPISTYVFKTLNKTSDSCLVDYILLEYPEIVTKLRSSKIKILIKKLSSKQHVDLWKRLSQTTLDPTDFHEADVMCTLKILRKLKIPHKGIEFAALCLRFLQLVESPFLSLRVAKIACSAFEKVQAINLKFCSEDLELVLQFVTKATNATRFPRLVSLARKSIAVYEGREDWLLFESSQLQNFVAKPLTSWCCGDIEWSEGTALAKILKNLSYTQILNIFNDEAFNTTVLVHVFRSILLSALQGSMSLNDCIHLMCTEERSGLNQKWPLAVASFDYIIEALDKLENSISKMVLPCGDKKDADLPKDTFRVISDAKLQQIWACFDEILKLKSLIRARIPDGNPVPNNFVPTSIFGFSFLYMGDKLLQSDDVPISMVERFLEFAAVALEDDNFLYFFNAADHPGEIFNCVKSLHQIIERIMLTLDISFVCSRSDEVWHDMNDQCVEILRSFLWLTDFILPYNTHAISMDPHLFNSIVYVNRGVTVPSTYKQLPRFTEGFLTLISS